MTDDLNELMELGEGFGMETPKWEYPTVGYNSADGGFYVGGDILKELDITILAVRRCKEVQVDSGVIRYHPYFPREGMATGKISHRVQAVVNINGAPHLFGAKSWTARALFDNPPVTDKYHDPNYQPGLWRVMLTWIQTVKTEKGVDTSPYCWSVKLGIGRPFKNPVDKRRDIYPIKYEGPPFRFVGKEEAGRNKAFIINEDLLGWVNQWHKARGEREELVTNNEGFEEPHEPSEIPF